MRPYIKAFGKTAIIFLLLFTAFFLMLYSIRKQPADPTWVEEGVIQQSAPVQFSLTRMTSNLLYDFKSLFVWQKKAERMQLESQVKEWKKQQLLHDEAVAENARLKKLLGYRENFSFKSSLAKVIYRDPSNWARSLVIDQGGETGLGRGMAVFCPDGVVGKLDQLSPKSARVLLILDPACSVSALVKRSRVIGAVAGRGDGMLIMKFLSGDDDIQVGDTVVTAGEGRVFPRGLMIGTVEKVKKKQEGLSMDVEIRPSVDFHRLEEVLIAHRSME